MLLQIAVPTMYFAMCSDASGLGLLAWLPALAWLGLKENFARQQAVLRMAIKSSSRVYAISVLYPLK